MIQISMKLDLVALSFFKSYKARQNAGLMHGEKSPFSVIKNSKFHPRLQMRKVPNNTPDQMD